MSKVKTGLDLVAMVTPAMPFIITSVDEKIKKNLGLGHAFEANQAYIVIALGTSAGGHIYLLTKNDIGEFVWVPEFLCINQIHQPQQKPNLVVPKMLVS